MRFMSGKYNAHKTFFFYETGVLVKLRPGVPEGAESNTPIEAPREKCYREGTEVRMKGEGIFFVSAFVLHRSCILKFATHLLHLLVA